MIIDDLKMVGSKNKWCQRLFFFGHWILIWGCKYEKKNSLALPFFHGPVIIHDYCMIIKNAARKEEEMGHIYNQPAGLSSSIIRLLAYV